MLEHRRETPCEQSTQRSADGSTLFSYTADSGSLPLGPQDSRHLCSRCLFLFRYGTLGHYPAGKHQPGEKRQIWDWDSGKYLGEIDEAPYTYNEFCLNGSCVSWRLLRVSRIQG